jgi:hypothetical protein
MPIYKSLRGYMKSEFRRSNHICPKTKLPRFTWHVKFGNGVIYTKIQNSLEIQENSNSLIQFHTTRCQQNIMRQLQLRAALSLLWSKVISIYRTVWCSDRDTELYSGGAWSQYWPRHVLSRGFSLFSSAPPILFRDSTSIRPEPLILNEFTVHQPPCHRRYTVWHTDIDIKQGTKPRSEQC